MKMMNRQNFLPLLLGLLTGVLSAISLLQYQGLTSPSIAPDPDYALGGTSFYFVSLVKKRDEERTRQGDSNRTQENEIEEWLGTVGSKEDENTGRKKRENLLSDEAEEYREEAMGLDKDLMEIASLPAFDTYNDAQRLKDKMKVLCMVAVTEDNVAFATAIVNTWMNHCTRVMVISNTPVNIKSHFLRTDLKPGRYHSWDRTKVLLAEAHDRFVEEFDWFVKVPQDGFVVLENLRYLILLHQANIPGYIGQVFKGPSGSGSVLVLSRFALELVGPSLIVCTAGYFQGSNDEDVLETCFRNLDVISLMDGRDQEGAFRFQMKVPRLDLPGGATRRKQWNWRYTLHPDRQDDSCCQEYPISFHNIDVNEMYVLEYAVYHLRPFGIGNYTCLSSSTRLGDLWKYMHLKRNQL